ncbi:type II toxin-antitoxin system VapC family toxin [Roseomonas sp. SSH11]|uniref:Ribonuclease VapC n=1 Tax=Pararoseomonas baculiformis TaxID=2820812 RepID=A0ABS4AL89_9PROT|nr:type II toxin-antitoxin system VapC family toxin [Pararoseomonas baculiformis]MBP0447795.1 type II toxin-antitoxin system VapC family toxin [Pararoseomonas baculiformis]
MYLVDTNVLSAGAPTKAIASPDLVAWMDRNSASLFLSVITVAELEDGIAKLRRQGATQKAKGLTEWLEVLLHLYGKRIIPVDLGAARHMGRLSDLARSKGHDPGLADIAIAATALQHGCSILTRNVRHFEPLEVPVQDPFSALPADS